MSFKVICSTILLLFSFSSKMEAQDTLADLFHATYKVFEIARNDNNGLYRDAIYLNNSSNNYPSSIATVGIGLVSLCIADAMGWENNAAQKSLLTLKTMNGYTPNVQFQRSPNGFFRHWVDMNTGATAWNSEYSSIDNAILLSGALFCKNYFNQDDSIAKYASELCLSIDWSNTIADTLLGTLNMVLDGAGIGNNPTYPYNEYMLVAWLAMQAEGGNGGAATTLWNRHFASADSLPTNFYQGIELLTDDPSGYIPTFTLQSPYYLCHYFATQPDYMQFLDNSRRGDSLYMRLNTTAAAYEAYMGAGEAVNYTYHADEINDNPGAMVSPHILAGFSPVFSQTKQHLLSLYQNQKGLYTLPNTSPPNKILWRYSLNQPSWNAPVVQGIDYAHMLFGLASMPQFLGVDFFKNNNDYDCSIQTSSSIIHSRDFHVDVYPNPNEGNFNLEIQDVSKGEWHFTIYSINGELILSETRNILQANGNVPIKLRDVSDGLYLLRMVNEDGVTVVRKFVVGK